jgi:hypothetical protein
MAMTPVTLLVETSYTNFWLLRVAACLPFGELAIFRKIDSQL